MKTIRNHSFWVIIGMCVFLSGMILEKPYAIDCAAVMDTVQKERSLLIKQKLLSQAVKECPGNSLVIFEYAYNCERLRKYEEALKAYATASKLSQGKLVDAFWGMGDTYMILGDVKSAIQAYEKGLRQEPDNDRARRNLELARIKYKAQIGSKITSDEFAKVMEDDKPKSSDERSVKGPLLRIPIQFPFSSAMLTPKAKEQLNIVGEAVQRESLKNSRFEVAGHTDDTGDPSFNLTMSENRAKAVRAYLVKTFMIAPDRLVIAYYGQNKPAVPNTNNDNRAINRRVEFRRLD